MTYNTRPAHGAQFATNTGGSNNTYREVDITDSVETKKGGLFSFAVETNDSDDFNFASRESSNKQQLVVTFSDTSSPTNTPTPQPTNTPGPTNTPVPQGVTLNFNLLLQAIGKGCDNVTPGSNGNFNPVNPQRTLTVEIFDSSSQLVKTVSGIIIFNSTIGNFTGTIDAGVLETGPYNIRIKSDRYLRRLVPGIQNLSAGNTYSVPQTTLVVGDSNRDNLLNILDCYSDLGPAKDCADPQKKLMADLNDDGNVNQIDYNLFLRNLSVQTGQ